MVTLYHIVLTFLGLQLYKKNIIDDNLDIEIGLDNSVRMITGKSQGVTPREKMLKCLKYIYNLFIISVLAWTIIASFIISINTSSSAYFINCVYNIIFTIHYICSIKYFKKDHIYDILNKHANAKHICEIAILVSLIITVAIAISIVVCITSEKTVHVYSYFYDSGKMTTKNIFLIILLIIDTIYSYITFFTISITFCIVMLYHKTTITSYSVRVDNYVHKPTASNAKINTIATEYTELKEKFSKTVKLLNNFFVSMNIFGIIGLYLTIIEFQTQTYEFTFIINTFLFVLIEIVYILSIQIVRKKVNKIMGLLTSKQFVSSVFRLYNTNRNIELISGTYTTQNIGIMVQHNLISTLSIDESIDWVVLNAVISKEWDTFNILGVKLEDTTILQKMIGVIFLFLVSQGISDLFK
jgi:hypothetical protein